MNFFICRTIFQVYYASLIIKKNKIRNVCFVYLSEEFNERERFVLKNYIGEYYLVKGSNQLSRTLSQLVLLLSLKKKRKENNGKHNVFFASIDDLFIQTIISLFKFDNIYTFDDGTANYINNSIFYIERKAKFKIRLKYFLMGNKIKNIHEIKARIKKHHTSNSLPNIVEKTRVVHIPLVDVDIDTKTYKANKFENSFANVYLCPNFDEIYIDPDSVREYLISSISPTDIVIPHPRDNFVWDENVNYILRKNTFAEEVVRKLIMDGYYVNLYGIANSTQYHYLNDPHVNNIILDIGTIKPIIRDVIHKQIELFKNLAKPE
jgi:beta-galactosamide-alpha-2,3-sialyltransferase